MTVMARDGWHMWLRPFPAMCLAGALTLFLATALSDWAYYASYEIQWNNFASWLLVGALVLSAMALVLSLPDIVPRERRTRGGALFALVLLAAWVVGFFNALMHARDAWASMPAGLWMSWIASLLAAVATWLGFRSPRAGGEA